jgi:SAM-dependent methyltransferase
MTPESESAVRLLETVNSAGATQAIYVAAELRLPDLLAASPKSAEELARLVNVDAVSLSRLLRLLAAFEIVAPRADGTFDLLPQGHALRTDSDDSIHAWALNWGRYLWEVWGNLLYSVRTGQSARQMLLGKPGFQPLADDPERAAIFNQSMLELTRLAAREVVRVYDFSEARRICDVGGGFGELLLTILRAAPAARGLLFDMPHALDGARRHFGQAGLADRCDFVAGDFFAEVPAADIYLLKSIVHDWDDERSAAILANCRRALAPGGRILLIERVVPDPIGLTASDRLIALSDVHMLVALGGAQERTRAQFESLLSSAGLRLTRLFPAGPMFSVIEAEPLL